MNDISVVAVAIATVVAFAISNIWYIALGTQLARLNPVYAEAAGERPPLGKVAIEIVRSLVVATVVAGLADRLDIGGWTEGLLLGLVLWIGFPIVLWTGAVMWEKIAPRLAAIHAGDWLLKLVAIAIILTAWG